MLAAPYYVARQLAFAAVAGLVLLAELGGSQKGLASLNDPCDCMQHHDFWMATRASLKNIFWVPDFQERVFDTGDQVNHWVRTQSCVYSPENEESHRPTALSDCIPGFILL